MTYPLLPGHGAPGALIRVPLVVTCQVLGFSKQGLYKWKKNPVTTRDWAGAHLINAALDIHRADPQYGYRFICDELADIGIKASEPRVRRLCSQQHIWSLFAKKAGLRGKAGPPVHGDLVKPNCTASAVNELWLTEATEHQSSEGKLYLCAVKEVYSNRIVGYSIETPMKSSLGRCCRTQRDLDRKNLSPSSAPTRTRSINPDRVRKNRCGSSSRMKTTNQLSQLNLQQSPMMSEVQVNEW